MVRFESKFLQKERTKIPITVTVFVCAFYIPVIINFEKPKTDKAKMENQILLFG